MKFNELTKGIPKNWETITSGDDDYVDDPDVKVTDAVEDGAKWNIKSSKNKYIKDNI